MRTAHPPTLAPASPHPAQTLPGGEPGPVIAEAACPIISNDWVNAEYKHMVIAASSAFLEARPGQFFNLRCPAAGSDRPFLRRPMSLYRIDSERGHVEFLYKVQGAGTRRLASLGANDVLDVLGPVGQGFNLEHDARHILLLGRGAGIATLAPIADHARAAGAKVTAVLSARSRALLISRERLADAGASLICVTDEERSSGPSNVNELLQSAHTRTPFDFMASCGSSRLIRLLQGFGRQHRILGQAAMEQLMGCAMGMCFACVHPIRKHAGSNELTYQRVCCEGPVFDLQKVMA